MICCVFMPLFCFQVEVFNLGSERQVKGYGVFELQLIGFQFQLRVFVPPPAFNLFDLLEDGLPVVFIRLLRIVRLPESQLPEIVAVVHHH